MKRLLLLLSLLLVTQLNAEAKDFGIGITGSYVYSVHQMNYAPLCPCGNYSNKLSGGQNIGAVTEIPVIGKSLLSIVLKIGLVRHSYNVFINGDNFPSLVKKSDTQVDTVRSFVIHNLKADIYVLNGNLLFKSDPLGINLNILAGLYGGYIVDKHIINSLNVIDPPYAQLYPLDGYVYFNNYRTVIARDDDMPEAEKYQYGISAGLQYDARIGSLSMSPFILFNYSMKNFLTNQMIKVRNNEPIESGNWKINYWQAGVDFIFHL